MAVLDLSPYYPVDDTLTDANAITGAFQAIDSVVNALDNSNIAVGAGIAVGKLAGGTEATWLRTVGGAAVFVDRMATRQTTLVTESNTTSETDWLGTQGSGLVIPAGTAQATQRIEINIFGQHLAKASSTPTSRMQFYFDGAIGFDTGTLSLSTSSASPTPVPIWVRILILPSWGGATSGRILSQIQIGDTGGTAVTSSMSGIGTVTKVSPYLIGTSGTSGFDITLAHTIRFTHIWSVADANNTNKITHATLEVL